MEHFAGIDVSLELSSVCVVDATGRIVREAKVASEPEALVAWFRGLGTELARIGLEAGPLSQWLFAAMRDAGLAVELRRDRRLPGTGQRLRGGRCGADRPRGQAGERARGADRLVPRARHEAGADRAGFTALP